MNEKEKKPKCYGCRKRGEDPFYYWHAGHLWHYVCAQRIAEIINTNIKSK